jgi:hypothetical protein
LVEQPAVLECAQPQTGELSFGQVFGESRHQALTILRAVLASLLEFDDVGADEPVAEDEALVDRRRRAPDRRRVGLRDGRQELAVVHGNDAKTLGAEANLSLI